MYMCIYVYIYIFNKEVTQSKWKNIGDNMCKWSRKLGQSNENSMDKTYCYHTDINNY